MRFESACSRAGSPGLPDPTATQRVGRPPSPTAGRARAANKAACRVGWTHGCSVRDSGTFASVTDESRSEPSGEPRDDNPAAPRDLDPSTIVARAEALGYDAVRVARALGVRLAGRDERGRDVADNRDADAAIRDHVASDDES